MAGSTTDDDHVANLLKQDARNAAKKYDLVGLDAFNPKRSRSGAPKPNTSFLRHIIRQTDSHNAALLAKEAEDSRARLKEMNKDKERTGRSELVSKSRGAGRLTPPDLREEDARYSKRRRTGYSDGHEERKTRRRRRHRDESRDYRSARDKQEERDWRGDRRREESDDSASRSRRSRHSRRDSSRERRRGLSSKNEESTRRHRDSSHRLRRPRSYSRSISRSPSPRPRGRQKSSRHRHRSRSSRHQSRSPRTCRHGAKTTKDLTRRRSASLASDSDPLEAIVGPLPPPCEPVVRARGRGAHKANSMGIDARFSSTYNPSVDVHLNSDLEDDWGDALEALRDRQRWKQQGAERLKAAGFSDEQVNKWERGDEKNEADVTWTTHGEGREWDRGKVLDEDGDIELKADWGRLK